MATRVNNIYNLAVKAAAEIYYQTGEKKYLDRAFSYSEKSKSQVLLSSVREADAIKEGMIPPDLRLAEERIKDKIMAFLRRSLIYSMHHKIMIIEIQRIAELQQDLYNQKMNYDSLIASLEVNYPIYYNLKYNFSVIPLEEVQKELKSDQLFIEYKLADTLLYTFVVSSDTVILSRTLIDTSFASRVEKFINLMKTLV